jgi:hypothetical protein
MRESIVVICPTAQGESRAALWHDGQIGHGWHARIARRAQIGRCHCRISQGFTTALWLSSARSGEHRLWVFAMPMRERVGKDEFGQREQAERMLRDATADHI